MVRLLSMMLFGILLQSAPQTQEIDPAFQTLAERFFAAQQAEDIESYLALWAGSAAKPTADQLRFVFSTGDDVFSDVSVTRAVVTGETARIRVAATRTRADARVKRPDGSPRTFTSRLQLALSLVRDGQAWRIVREGAPADALAAALIESNDPEVRRRLLDEEPELLNARLVDAIARRADDLAQRAQYKAALAIYERSLEVARATRDPKAEGQALQNIANSHYFLRNFAESLKQYQQRLALARETKNDEGTASALMGIGTVLYSTYEYAAALEAYREALAIQELRNDGNLAGTTLISTGNVLYLQGDFAAAIADYRRAEDLKREAGDSAGAASALEGLGRVYTSQGDYAAALSAFAAVLEARRASGDGPRQALVLQSIGGIHFRLGNTDAARSAYQEGRRLFEKLKDLGNAGRALQGAALTELVAGRFPAGEKAYADSITSCTTATDAECIAHAQVGLAFALAAQKKFDDAVTWYGRSLISFNELKMEEAGARARVGLADALYGRGDYDKALEQAVTARRTAVALDSDDVLWRALVSAARAERKLGRPALALGSARAAVLTVERMAAAALDRPGHATPGDSAAAYAALAVLHAEQGDAPAAFNALETMRLHSLRATLAPSEREIARGMTSEERAEEHRLATALTTLLAQRTSERGLPRPDGTRLAKLDAAIKEATATRAAAREKLFSRLPDLRTWRGLGSAATAEDLPAILDADGKVLLQFMVDEHDLLIVLAGRNAREESVVVETFVRPVERQDLAERIARALDSTALATVDAWRTASKDLFALLPPEAIDALAGARSIIIVPDDTLWRVPFEALPLRDRYLADRAAVTYATSATAALKPPVAAAPSGSIQPEKTTPSVIVLSSPAVAPSLIETLEATAPNWALRLPEIGEKEVKGIKAIPGELDVLSLTGAGATRAALRSAALQADALHIAAPFRVNSGSPLFSSILLAEPPVEKPVEGITPPQPVSSNDMLDVRGVFNLTSSARVVLLSDPGALSMRDAARGITPVSWAWRATGAETLILRRWGGREALSNEVVARFYETLAGGKPPEQALDEARAAIRNTEAGRAPAAWAGWIVISGR